MKPRKRNHVAAGSRVVRGNIREENPAGFGAPDPQPFLPVYSLWPAMVAQMQAEGPLFPRGDGAKGLKTLRGTRPEARRARPE